MKKLFILIYICLSSLTTFAQLDRSKRPTPGPAPAIRLGKYESFQLANGLKIFVVTNKKLPRVAVNLILDYIPPLEKEVTGLGDITGQMLRTGTQTRTKDQIDEQIDFLGATLYTSSSGAYGSSLKKHQDKLMEIMADLLLHPSFKQEELDKIKTEKKNELSLSKDEPESILQQVKSVVLYGKDHPYGEITTEKSIDAITLDKINTYYTTYFKPNIGYMAFVGDITLAEAKALTEKYFSTWKQGTVPTPTYIQPKVPAKTKVIVVNKPEAVQTVLSIAYPIDFKPGPPDAIKASITNDILGYGGFSGRLFQNLREKHGYTYGAYSSLQNDRLVGSFSAGGNIKTNVIDSAITEIVSEMRRIRDVVVTDAELKQTKNIRNGIFVQSLEDPQTIARFALNTARYKLPADYYSNYLKNIEAVKIPDIQSMAKKYILPENAYILVVGNASEFEAKLQQFGEIIHYDAEGNKIEASTTSSTIPADITADKIIGNYINAIGGKEKLIKIRDVSTSMSARVQGMEMTGIRQQKTPNKLKMSMKIASMGMEVLKIVSNGNKATFSAMGNTQELTGKELESTKAMNTLFPELYYDQIGVTRTLKGTEKINGSDTYVIELTLPGGSKTTEYFEINSGLKIRQILVGETNGQTVSQTTNFGDYREVSGVKFPYLLSTSFGPQVVDLKVTSIELNKGLGDEIFE
ncbi:pitrilysin family protein [Cytophagaceae bacterium YF14B1]|uniref:Pitrilysin family protein n=1 Tax=Xanthocytophaga flava TaxID=3048013 RepID=A0AAE3QL62_9BACT|nr:pitrilysin family protein [Xanthocytophaga flavus]MDJ1479443.1 pitrilysin family protein [Xanthocytophaga flavus]